MCLTVRIDAPSSRVKNSGRLSRARARIKTFRCFNCLFEPNPFAPCVCAPLLDRQPTLLGTRDIQSTEVGGMSLVAVSVHQTLDNRSETPRGGRRGAARGDPARSDADPRCLSCQHVWTSAPAERDALTRCDTNGASPAPQSCVLVRHYRRGEMRPRRARRRRDSGSRPRHRTVSVRRAPAVAGVSAPRTIFLARRHCPCTDPARAFLCA